LTGNYGVINHKPTTERRTTMDEEDSKRKWECIIDRKDLGEKCISCRALGGLRVRKS